MKKRVSLVNPYATLEEWETEMFTQLLATVGACSEHEFVACTGAKNFVFDSEDEGGSVSFDIKPGVCAVHGTKRILVRKTSDDLFTIDFFNRGGKKIGTSAPRRAHEMEEYRILPRH